MPEVVVVSRSAALLLYKVAEQKLWNEIWGQSVPPRLGWGRGLSGGQCQAKATQADPQPSTLSAVWRLDLLHPQTHPHGPLSHTTHTPLEAKHISWPWGGWILLQNCPKLWPCLPPLAALLPELPWSHHQALPWVLSSTKMSGAQDSAGFPGPLGSLSARPSISLSNSVCRLGATCSESPPGPEPLSITLPSMLCSGPVTTSSLLVPWLLGAEPPGQRALLQLIYSPVLSLQTRAGTGEAPGECPLNRKKACTPGTQGGPWAWGAGARPGRAAHGRPQPHLGFSGALTCPMRTRPPAGVVRITETHVKLWWALQMTGDQGLRSPWCPLLLRPPWQEPSGWSCSSSQDCLILYNPQQRDNLWTARREKKEDGSYIRLAHKTDMGKKQAAYTLVYTITRKSLQFLSFGATWMLQKKALGIIPNTRASLVINVGVDTVTPGEQGVLAAVFFSSWFSHGRVNTGAGPCTYKGLPWPSIDRRAFQVRILGVFLQELLIWIWF